MRLYFSGADSPAHLATLKACGVERVAVNITSLARRTKHLGGWATKERLESLEWIAYADSPVTPWEPLMELLDGAEVPPEMIIGPPPWYEDTWLKSSDVLFLPTWDGTDMPNLRALAEEHDGIALHDTVVDNPMSVRTARSVLSYYKNLAALTGRSRAIDRFDLVASSAWWAVQKHGETQVWADGRLVRLNSEDQHIKRQRYLPAIEALGVDPAAVLADDSAATVRLAVKSWLALEVALTARRGHPSHPSEPSEVDDVPRPVPLRVLTTPQRVASTPSQTRHVLPVIGYTTETTTTTDEHGVEHVDEQTILTVASASVRRCDSCFLAAGCPSFNPGSNCAYEIPVEIRSKDQLQGVLRAMVEIQTQRVLMGRFGEEITGQPDEMVGRELDRLLSMVERWRNIEDNRDTFKAVIEARGSMGVLSRLFGSKAGDNARALDRPIASTLVMEEVTDVTESDD